MDKLCFTFFRKPSTLWDEAIALRMRVFVDEQGVPEDMETDVYDETADHLLVRDGGRIAVGTLRIAMIGATGKLGRVAVAATHRRRGIATLMMAAAVSHCRTLGLKSMELDAQTYIAGFYQGIGFTPVGAEFMDAGILHVHMVRALDGSGAARVK